MTDTKKEELIRKLRELAEEDVRLEVELNTFRQKNITLELKKRIMKSLHNYNDIKDVTQVVLGHLAVNKCLTVTELHNMYNVPMEDL